MQQARFAEGVTLLAGSLPARVAVGDELVLRLHWEFAQGRDDLDVRFVHLLDAEGRLVAQSDETLGLLPAGSQLSERISWRCRGTCRQASIAHGWAGIVIRR